MKPIVRITAANKTQAAETLQSIKEGAFDICRGPNHRTGRDGKHRLYIEITPWQPRIDDQTITDAVEIDEAGGYWIHTPDGMCHVTGEDRSPAFIAAVRDMVRQAAAQDAADQLGEIS